MTTWFCVTPSITLAILGSTALLYLVCYYVIKKTSNQNAAGGYVRLENSDTEGVEQEKSTQQSKLSTKDKMSVLKKLFSYIAVPSLVVFYCKYLIIQSVVTTVAFKNAPFRPRDHYQYYVFILLFGDLIGKSHRAILAAISSRCLYDTTHKGLWVLTLIESFHMIFLCFESWYRFVPRVEIVLILCFSSGVFSGMLYSNAMEFFSTLLEGKQREFGMGFSLCLMDVGALVAAFAGLYLEPRLREHCVDYVEESIYCVTRSRSLNDVAMTCGTKSA